MKIVQGYPPNFAMIADAFPAARRSGTIFTYGTIIYVTSGEHLSDALMAHEAVHSRQQGHNPDAWWKRYIEDEAFRFDQELEAHREEYRVAAQNHSRPGRRRALSVIAKRLAGPLYGRIVNLDKAKALVAA